MFCSACGSSLVPGAMHCGNCGSAVQSAQAAAVEPDQGQPFGQPAQPAYGQAPYGQPAYQQPYQQGYAQPGYYQPATQSGKAIASLVLSLFGISLIGLILGYSARKEIRAAQGRIDGDGIALAGIIIGWIGTIGWTLLWILVIVAAAMSDSYYY